MIFKLVSFVATSALIYLAIALGLIVSQPVPKMKSGGQTLDFEGVVADGFALPVDDERVVHAGYATPDGASHPITYLRRSRDDSLPIVVMVHGSGWHGGQFFRLGWALADLAEIRIVTLRGHGADPVRRGDIDYIGQFEDDLALAIGDNPTGREVILLGHSSGAGLVVRMAGGPHGGLIDRAVLLAPYLQYNAPTTRPNSGGWAQPLTRRIIGLSMLNAVGLHALDHLTAIQFRVPQAVLDGPQGHMATPAYSWRLNQSFSPRRDWQGDVARLPDFLLIAGARDEAFDAALYEPTLAPLTGKGRYEILPDTGHLGVVDAPRTVELLREFLQ